MTHAAPPAADYARAAQRDAWLRHPVLGDPSCDAFERYPGNPLHRGAPPFEWPVNCSLFRDPPTGRWYAYVGHYAEGYAVGADKGSMCTVYESTDDGRTWSHLGPVFEPEPFTFAGTQSPVRGAPDVTVVYADGRYHMAFDWGAADFSWAGGGSSGVGYAWSDSPAGPFRRQAEPLVLNTRMRFPILSKYNRLYASTLVRRAHDWLLLTITDSGPYFSWGLVALRADAPGGPYADPVPLFHTEDDRYQPPLMEYFPAFVHAGYLYAPATSVALNRNYQLVHRAPLEEAHRPEAWTLYQCGSLWHAEPVEHEAYGLWGQTLAGCVDPAGTLRVLFPSRDSRGMGTINLAQRVWSQPWREAGFVLSGHQGPALTCLRRAWADVHLDLKLGFTGSAALLWGMTGPLGADAPRSDATLHALCRTQCYVLTLTQDTWALLRVDASGLTEPLAQGRWEAAPPHRLTLQHAVSGALCIMADGALLWEGSLALREGRVGLLAEAHSHLRVARFAVAGDGRPACLPWLYTEALLGAGQSMADWEV
ncbi:MAG: hypothetical protein GX557_02800, partial [Chloroflexi bacterium]|nr:hypothetical protein [Chloroflexota bacterium]